MPVLGMYSQGEVCRALGLDESTWVKFYRPPTRKLFLGVKIPKHQNLQGKFIVYAQDDARNFIDAVAETRLRYFSYRDLMQHINQYRYVKLRDKGTLCEYPIEPTVFANEYRTKYWWPRVNVLIVMFEVTTGQHRPRDNYLNDYLIDSKVPTLEQLENVHGIPSDLGQIMEYKPLRSVTA